MRWVASAISPATSVPAARLTCWRSRAISQRFAKHWKTPLPIGPRPPASPSKSGRGRESLQHVQVLTNTGQVDPEQWPDCQSLARIVSLRAEGGKAAARIETRYYISSARLDPNELAFAVKSHWAVENDLHWRLDVTLREDHAPQNLSIVRRLILNLLKEDTAHPKHSVRLRRKMAGWDDDERMRVLGILLI